MNFQVEPDNLERFGRLIGRAADDMRTAISYLDNNTQIGGSCASFLWDFIGSNHEQVVNEVKGGLKGFSEILDASKKELAKSAKYYRATDSATAAKLDETYRRPSGPRGWDETVLGDINPTDFRDVASPTDRLKPTDVDQNYFQEWGDEWMLNPVAKTGGSIMDFGSPVGIVAEGLNFCGIADVFAKPVQWLGGDWEGYLKAAEAWGNIAKFCTDVAENIDWGNRTLDESWNGNSADVAWVYFHEVAQKLRKATESLNSLQEQYNLLARTVYNAAGVVQGFLVTICDWVVEVILFNVAAAAALATIAGAPEAAALEALAMVRFMAALAKYREFLEMLELTANGVQVAGLALFGIATAFGSDVKSFPRPGSDYDNQAV